MLFAHVPLWMAYPQWGWGTEDGERALNHLKRFGSVTVLNGHIHQVLKKTEGNVTFHTGMSTAFPQPKPGAAPKPGPMKVEPGKLRATLGITDRSLHCWGALLGHRGRHTRLNMDPLLWQRLHGGSTHLPIVLLPLSLVLDLIYLGARKTTLAPGFRAAALATAALSLFGASVAVAAGLLMTNGELLGTGVEKLHHLFAWPAFLLSGVLVIWRLSSRDRMAQSALRFYFAGIALASGLMLGAGYWGGELLLHAETTTSMISPDQNEAPGDRGCIMEGRKLFAMNCSHCHGEDARGTDEAPNLTQYRRSDSRIANVVQNGIKGEMPRFGEKLNQSDIKALTAFLRSTQAGRKKA